MKIAKLKVFLQTAPTDPLQYLLHIQDCRTIERSGGDILGAVYSYFNESTGLAVAARIDLRLTVSSVMTSAPTHDATNTPHSN